MESERSRSATESSGPLADRAAQHHQHGGGLGPGSDSDQGSDQDYGPGSMMGGFGDDRTDYDDDDYVGARWMIVMMLLLIGGVAAVVYLVTRPRHGGSAPAELLAERFARGEIDAKEYAQRRALLGGSR